MQAERRPSSGASRWIHRGTASVEFACCLPLLSLILTGLWQVGRITEMQQVIWNSAREASRDASVGSNNLSAAQLDSSIISRGPSPRPSARATRRR